MEWTPEELVKDERGILALVFGFLYYMLLGKEERETKLGEYLEGLIKTE